MSVALVRATLGALVAPGTDRGGQFRFDELLADQADCFLDQVGAFALI